MLTGFAGGFISLVLFRSIATGGGEAVFSPSCMALLADSSARILLRIVADETIFPVSSTITAFV